MVAIPNPNSVQPLRLSPSGPEMGTPPAQIGGGALIPGREWYAQGTGADLVDVPNPAADVTGLSSVAVNMLAGYKYDLEVDAQFFGTTGGEEILVLGSSDGGGTYGAIGSTAAQLYTGSGRLHLTNVAGPYDHLKVQLASTNPAANTCQYLPKLTALRVREYSTSA